MSSYQGASYFNTLMEQANKLKTEQEARNRALISQYESKVRQKNISERARQASLSGSSSRTLVPRQRTLIEPELAYTKESVAGIGQLYKQAQAYDPFATKKTQAQLEMPLTYFNTLTGEVNTYIKGNQDKFASQIADVKARQEKEIEDIRKKYGINKNTINYYNSNDRNYVNDVAWLNRKYEQEINAYNTQLGRFNTIAGNVISSQTKTLGDLGAELKKYYGQNFENISKEQLAVADLSSFQSLTGDIAKYQSLRDSYIKKYQADPSKVNLDWINQYNDLLNNTAKAISAELPKIFTSAGKTVESIKKSQQSSLTALEQLNKVFGDRGQSTLKPQVQERKVTDVPAETTRQQVLARQQRVSTFGEQSKPSPKFTARPM